MNLQFKVSSNIATLLVLASAAAALFAAQSADATEPAFQRAVGELAGSPSAPPRLLVSLKVDQAQPLPQLGIDTARSQIIQFRKQIVGTSNLVRSQIAKRDPQSVKSISTFQNVPAIVVLDRPNIRSVLKRSPQVSSFRPVEQLRPLLDWAADAIGATAAQSAGFHGRRTTAAVIDSGIDSNHQFLGGAAFKYEACFGNCPAGEGEYPGAGEPCFAFLHGACDHGTEVSSAVAGRAFSYNGNRVVGVADQASLASIQVCNVPSGFSIGCDEQAILSGLDYVIAQVAARRGKDAPTRVVNLSVGSGWTSGGDCSYRYPATRAAVDQLNALGVVVVAASGNSGESGSIASPACVDPVVSVGSVNRNDAASDFSDIGPNLDLLAYGEDVWVAHTPRDNWSQVLGGDFSVSEEPTSKIADTATGTSIAAPQVAGAIASLAAESPGLSVRQLIQLVKSSDVRVYVPRSGRDIPRLNVARAHALRVNGLKRNVDQKDDGPSPIKRGDGSQFAGGNNGPGPRPPGGP